MVQTQIDTIESALQQKAAVLPEMKDAIKAAKKKMDGIAQVAQAEERLLALEKELAWCLVVEKEAELAAKEQEVQGSEDRLKKAKLYVKQGTVRRVSARSFAPPSPFVALTLHVLARSCAAPFRPLQDNQESLEEQVVALEALVTEHQEGVGPTTELLRESEAQLKRFKAEYRVLDVRPSLPVLSARPVPRTKG